MEGGGRMEKIDYHDVDRRNMSHNDTDARYSGGRRVEKYDRPGMKGADYATGKPLPTFRSTATFIHLV